MPGGGVGRSARGRRSGRISSAMKPCAAPATRHQHHRAARCGRVPPGRTTAAAPVPSCVHPQTPQRLEHLRRFDRADAAAAPSTTSEGVRQGPQMAGRRRRRSPPPGRRRPPPYAPGRNRCPRTARRPASRDLISPSGAPATVRKARKGARSSPGRADEHRLHARTLRSAAATARNPSARQVFSGAAATAWMHRVALRRRRGGGRLPAAPAESPPPARPDKTSR